MNEQRLTPTWVRRCRVTHVIDGDTVRVDVDLGLDVVVNLRVRLEGVNAPEKRSDAGAAAKGYVEAWVAAADAGLAEWPLVIRTSKVASDLQSEKYGRFLGTLQRASDGAVLNADVIAAGHAKPWNGIGVRPE